MKVRLVMFFASLIILLAGCERTEDVSLFMATGGIAGTYFPLGMAMADVIYENTGIDIEVVASGASRDNIRQIAAGRVQLAIAQNDIMSYAFHGTGIWNRYDAVTNFSTLMTLYPEIVQVVVAANSDIFSVDDLAGRRVSIGDVGSGVEANAIQILDVHGLTRNDIYPVNMGFSDSAEAVREFRIDAFFVTSAAPNAAVMYLASHKDVRILPMSDDVIRLLKSRYPFYTESVLDSTDYPWITEPISTVAVHATLIASDDVCEQVAYDIVRTLIENRADINHPMNVNITMQNATQSISVDFHAGARRFFESRGGLYEVLVNTYLQILDAVTGLSLWQHPLSENNVFHITYTHSVNQSPVREVYKIANEQIVLYAMYFYSFGAGMPAGPEDGQVLTHLPDGGMRLSSINRVMYTFVNVSDYATGHTLHIGGALIPMYSLTDNAVRLMVGR
ncbi:MAG: TAXI family TRAP transporter solute-binding subunit [Defluviitaleaceae bacterium]|nr:TAXI family TRAP transporter solute-binding subunit [Defluviitaleaceae bacterium]MCL2262270.1 TAXI family TRAP transporter solute-binding subunit [Defluviitaleaceae bacterium]